MSYMYERAIIRVYWEETTCICWSTSTISNVWFSFVGEMEILQKTEKHSNKKPAGALSDVN